jgi:hypothetical protein
MYSDPFARMLELIDRKEEMYLAAGKTCLEGKGVSFVASWMRLLHMCSHIAHFSP